MNDVSYREVCAWKRSRQVARVAEAALGSEEVLEATEEAESWGTLAPARVFAVRCVFVRTCFCSLYISSRIQLDTGTMYTVQLAKLVPR